MFPVRIYSYRHSVLLNNDNVLSANLRRMVWKEKVCGASVCGEDFLERVGFGRVLKERVGLGSREVKLLKLYPEKTGGKKKRAWPGLEAQ